MADMTYRMNDGRLALVMVIVTHVVVREISANRWAYSP